MIIIYSIEIGILSSISVMQFCSLITCSFWWKEHRIKVINTKRLIVKITAIIANMLYSIGSNAGESDSFIIIKKITVDIINVTIVMAIANTAIIFADVELNAFIKSFINTQFKNFANRHINIK